jgi:outer membrane protein insertion porin family
VGGFLGGDDSFYKLEYSWARYQPAFARAVYATRLKAGWVKEFGSSHDVPSNDRFYLGGANSIRGFKENSVGPVNDQGAGVGANAYTIFNQELRIPLFWRFWGSVFADIGNGWESLSAINVNDLLFAYGAGLQFVSPAGPIRLDYARHLESGRYKESDRLHLTILYAF